MSSGLTYSPAEFYGKGWSLGNLEMLSRFYEKYPDYAEKTFLSVKVTTSTTMSSCLQLTRPYREAPNMRAAVTSCVSISIRHPP